MLFPGLDAIQDILPCLLEEAVLAGEAEGEAEGELEVEETAAERLANRDFLERGLHNSLDYNETTREPESSPGLGS